MATSTNACGNIRLNFYWAGEKELCGGSSQGGYDVRDVELKFNEDTTTKYIVSIPGGRQSYSKAIKLPFIWTHDHGEVGMPLTGLRVRNVTRVFVDSLEISLEKVRNLKIEAVILKGGTSGTFVGGTRVFQSYDKIALAIPTELSEGRTYGLVVGSTSTSGSYSLSASLQEVRV